MIYLQRLPLLDKHTWNSETNSFSLCVWLNAKLYISNITNILSENEYLVILIPQSHERDTL